MIFLYYYSESLASKALHWVELFPFMKLQNIHVDWKKSTAASIYTAITVWVEVSL